MSPSWRHRWDHCAAESPGANRRLEPDVRLGHATVEGRVGLIELITLRGAHPRPHRRLSAGRRDGGATCTRRGH